ncbi:MAG: hypothetical protein HQL64_00085 [Magnetococcales bacterium]|nr:hypothetical protein [Magnetococcales bacterium]
MGDSNAERQRRFASKARDSGKIRIHAWVDVSTASQLRELANQSDATVGDIINMAVGTVCSPDHFGQTDQGYGTHSPPALPLASAVSSSDPSSQGVQNNRSPYLFRPVPGNDMPRLETPVSLTEKNSNRSKSILFYSFVLIMLGVGAVSWYRVLPYALPDFNKTAAHPSPPSPRTGEVRIDVTSSIKPGNPPAADVGPEVNPPAAPTVAAQAAAAPTVAVQAAAAPTVAAQAVSAEDRVKLALALEFKR